MPRSGPGPVTALAAHGDLAGGDRFEAGDHAQQRGFAAAGGTDQADEFAGRDRQVGVAQGLDPAGRFPALMAWRAGRSFLCHAGADGGGLATAFYAEEKRPRGPRRGLVGWREEAWRAAVFGASRAVLGQPCCGLQASRRRPSITTA